MLNHTHTHQIAIQSPFVGHLEEAAESIRNIQSLLLGEIRTTTPSLYSLI